MKSLKVREYKVDTNLGYLIQQITNDSTQEVLSYFYSISQFVIANLAAKSKASWLNKDIILFYKDTPISYRIQISGTGPGYRMDDKDYEPSVSISVKFPNKSEEQDVANLMNAVVESGLQLTDEQNMPAFERPELKTPKCLREVRIAQNEQRTKGTST